jgi:hypothetical protein
MSCRASSIGGASGTSWKRQRNAWHKTECISFRGPWSMMRPTRLDRQTRDEPSPIQCGPRACGPLFIIRHTDNIRSDIHAILAHMALSGWPIYRVHLDRVPNWISASLAHFLFSSARKREIDSCSLVRQWHRQSDHRGVTGVPCSSPRDPGCLPCSPLVGPRSRSGS